MRVVLDTNITISGLLWYGAPRQVLEAARRGGMHCLRFSSQASAATAAPLAETQVAY